MLLKSKDIAFTGIMMALGVLLVTLGGYFEGSTLFFLAAASFLAGIVFRNVSVGASILFVIGTTLLGIMLAPQKLYLATFLAFCIYILAAEGLEKALAEKSGGRKKIWAAKGILYHILLVVCVYLVQKFFGLEVFFDTRVLSKLEEFKILFVIIMILMAELVWLLFDKAYFYFQRRYGSVFRRENRM